MIYIFIISVLVLQTLVLTECMALNVRTALYTPNDLAKKRWNRKDIALLRARMYLQGLVPPMEVTQSPEYVRSLARYIENCYDSINRETFDRETETILTVAVSDVLGGYLKMVALPVTKNAYYNGELPTKDALILFKYYDDIKEQLDTDGQGWSEQLLNIAKTKNVRGIRSDTLLKEIQNPCQRLYLQNIRDNVTLPMPTIDWKSRTMFVPLTDQPLIDLRSPHISNVLHQFHHIARACERTLTPERRYFQGSFEDWVNEAVLPHLNDDDLYTAFKGILGLIDSTSLLSMPNNCTRSVYFFNFSNMSKKTIIIISILALELICCLPTLLYCVLKKKKKNGVGDADQLETLSGSTASTKSKSEIKKVAYCDNTVFYELSSRGSSFHDQRNLSQKESFNNYKKFVINEGTTMGSDLSSLSRRSCSSITDAATTPDEAPVKKYSRKEKKILAVSQQFRFKHTETDKILVNQNQTQVSNRTLLPRKSSTSTAINLNAPTLSNDTGETITLSNVLPPEKSASKVLRKSKRFKPRHTIESLTPDTYNPFPSKISNTLDELSIDYFENRMSHNMAVMQLSNIKNVDFAAPHVVGQTHTKNSEISCNRSQKSLRSASKKDNTRTVNILDEHKTYNVEGHDCHNSEMRKDRPRPRSGKEVSKQRITIESEVTSTNRKGILKVGEEKAKIKPNLSKIPKKTSSPRPQCDTPRPVVKRQPEGPLRRSRIPKPERALDDSAIHSTTPRDKKLNVTL